MKCSLTGAMWGSYSPLDPELTPENDRFSLYIVRYRDEDVAVSSS